MADEPSQAAGSRLATLGNIARGSISWLDPSQPLGLPENSVRGIIALVVVVGVMAMLWEPTKDAQGNLQHWAPQELLVLFSAVLAFYFTNPQANQQMRAFLAVVLVVGTVAFFYEYGAAPDALLAQASTVVVLYFGQKNGAAKNGNGGK